MPGTWLTGRSGAAGWGPGRVARDGEHAGDGCAGLSPQPSWTMAAPIAGGCASSPRLRHSTTAMRCRMAGGRCCIQHRYSAAANKRRRCKCIRSATSRCSVGPDNRSSNGCKRWQSGGARPLSSAPPATPRSITSSQPRSRHCRWKTRNGNRYRRVREGGVRKRTRKGTSPTSYLGGVPPGAMAIRWTAARVRDAMRARRGRRPPTPNTTGRRPHARRRGAQALSDPMMAIGRPPASSAMCSAPGRASRTATRARR